MTTVNIQRFILYNMYNGDTVECIPKGCTVKSLIDEYVYGNPPATITLGKIYCIRKFDSKNLLCMEVSSELPSKRVVAQCDWEYKGIPVESQQPTFYRYSQLLNGVSY